MKVKGILAFILSLCLLSVSVYYAATHMENPILCFDNFSAGEFGNIDDKFNISRDKDKIEVRVTANADVGDMDFQIISPDNKVVYETKGNKLREVKELNVNKGKWLYKLNAEGAKNLKCFVLIRRK